MKSPALHGALTVPYLSEAWAEQALRVIETHDGIRDALRGSEVSLLTIILRPPPGRYGFLYSAFDERGLRDYRVGKDYHSVTEGIDPPTFVVSGPYEVFAAVQRGEMTERRALMSGRLHLTGSWSKALRHMRMLETITGALGEIECKT